MLQEVRFDEANLGDEMRALDCEERELMDRMGARARPGATSTAPPQTGSPNGAEVQAAG